MKWKKKYMFLKSRWQERNSRKHEFELNNYLTTIDRSYLCSSFEIIFIETKKIKNVLIEVF